MNLLNNNEMYEVKGGMVSLKTASIVTSIFAFVMGIIEGFVHPKKCK